MAKTPEELLAEAEAKIVEKDAALLAKAAEVAAKEAVIAGLETELDEVKLEAKSKQDQQDHIIKTEGHVNELRIALAEAKARIVELEEEVRWRTEAMGEPRPPEPRVGPPAGPMPELPEWDRREQGIVP